MNKREPFEAVTVEMGGGDVLVSTCKLADTGAHGVLFERAKKSHPVGSMPTPDFDDVDHSITPVALTFANLDALQVVRDALTEIRRVMGGGELEKFPKYRSAISGLWYSNVEAAGDVDCVAIGDQWFYPEHKEWVNGTDA